MKLISMTDFVLQVVQTQNINEAICWEQTEKRLSKIYQYALFLKKRLALEMFVPCDEDGKPLQEPQMKEERNSFDEVDYDYDAQELYYYIKAKEKVLFKAFKYDFKDECVNYQLENNSEWFFSFDELENQTIESFGGIEGEIELTESAIEKIK